MRDLVSVSHKGTQDVVVVEGPIHDSIYIQTHSIGNLTVVVAFAGTEDGLVVMGELHKVDPVAFAVVGVDLLSSLQVIETHRVVLATRHQILPVMGDVDGVDLFLLNI